MNEDSVKHMAHRTPEVSFTRQANIPKADFPKEPHRNRLNVVIGRTNHPAHHRGQLALLGSR